MHEIQTAGISSAGRRIVHSHASAVPAVARSLGVIAAVNFVLLIYVVVRAEPPHRTTEPEMNFDPVTVRVIARLPAGALEGDIDVMPGTGFCVADGKKKRRICSRRSR